MSKAEKKQKNLAQAPEELEVEEGQEKKKGSVLNRIINVVLVITIIVAAVCTYISFVSTSGNGTPSILGLNILSIQTDSMSPTLLPGDLVFGTAVKNVEDLRPNDIITYWTVINGERVLNTHRIVQISEGLIFTTKGDANPIEDASTVRAGSIVCKYAGRVPGLGKVMDYLQTSTGFLLIVVLPVFIFFLYHVIQFFRVLFEYQNVKNRLKYEMERGNTEDLLEQSRKREEEALQKQREQMEAELREKLKAELLASMSAGNAVQIQEAPKPAEEAPAQEAAEEPAAEETPEEAPEEAAEEK